jgi:hypothetical protein
VGVVPWREIAVVAVAADGDDMPWRAGEHTEQRHPNEEQQAEPAKRHSDHFEAVLHSCTCDEAPSSSSKKEKSLPRGEGRWLRGGKGGGHDEGRSIEKLLPGFEREDEDESWKKIA